MRIIDWSSDVCSSDLLRRRGCRSRDPVVSRPARSGPRGRQFDLRDDDDRFHGVPCLPRPRGGQRAHQPLTPSPWIPWDSKNSRKKVQQRDFFGNQSPYSVVSLSSSGNRPPAALLSNIGPCRFPSPPPTPVRALFPSGMITRRKTNTEFTQNILALMTNF